MTFLLIAGKKKEKESRDSRKGKTRETVGRFLKKKKKEDFCTLIKRLLDDCLKFLESLPNQRNEDCQNKKKIVR